MNFKTAFSERVRVSFFTGDESLTKQCFKKECDINSIMLKWQKTGVLEHQNRFQGDYGDFTSASSYQEALESVFRANEAFASLPSSLRTRFSNDPAKFLAFVENSDNLEEMYSLGLAVKPDLVLGDAVGTVAPE